jgi:GntR family transcriptional regulator
VILFKSRLNPASAVPVYVQLMEQVKHAVETGALRPGDQLPGIRKLAESLVVNPNTVAKAYRELEHAGVIELRQGSGAFISDDWLVRVETSAIRRGQAIVRGAVRQLSGLGLDQEEIRRLFESELLRLSEEDVPAEERS